VLLLKAALLVVLPLASVTPGSTNPAVTQANIKTTICVTGYTATIRPPASYTTRLKIKQLATTYNFYTNRTPSLYEEDHLISLELGGNPTDPKNLWAQPWAGTGAHVKDQLENRLRALVCSGKLTLTDAQKQISGNWFLAYQKYVVKK
jgi:hypothetical protein